MGPNITKPRMSLKTKGKGAFCGASAEGSIVLRNATQLVKFIESNYSSRGYKDIAECNATDGYYNDSSSISHRFRCRHNDVRSMPGSFMGSLAPYVSECISRHMPASVGFLHQLSESVCRPAYNPRRPLSGNHRCLRWPTLAATSEARHIRRKFLWGNRQIDARRTEAFPMGEARLLADSSCRDLFIVLENMLLLDIKMIM